VFNVVSAPTSCSTVTGWLDPVPTPSPCVRPCCAFAEIAGSVPGQFPSLLSGSTSLTAAASALILSVKLISLNSLIYFSNAASCSVFLAKSSVTLASSAASTGANFRLPTPRFGGLSLRLSPVIQCARLHTAYSCHQVHPDSVS
jgi:hypothetical protein